MRHKPLIGIPCRGDTSGTYASRPINAQNDSYIQAVLQAGGVPFLIPLAVEASPENLRSLFALADGILLTGGGDIAPTFYNEQPSALLSDVQPVRDRLEVTITGWCLAEAKPVLGICRGIQVMAVAAGGTLWQDLPSQRPEADRHDYFYLNQKYPRDHIAHEVELEPSSVLARALETNALEVNSLHHQAVRQVSPPFRTVGCASDGVVEAIEVPGHTFAIGVQWHPEELVRKQVEARRLFSAFVSACANGQR
ncbi:MAG: gamma-glutamyl-gamma-aminobutyrate hydrolase family protein [Anaerolineae bacterium]